MLYIIGLIAVAIAVIFFLIGVWWGAPIALVIGLAGGLYVLAAHREGERVGTVERGRRAEPTGVPRKASADAETANERVGQA